MSEIFKKVAVTAIIMCGLSQAATVYSQEIVIIRTSESDKRILKDTKPNTPNTPQVPQFALTDKTGGFILTLGGFIQPIMGWDIGNNIDDISFVTNEIPVPSSKGDRSNFYLDPLYSAFDLHMVGLKGTKNQITAYVAAKFTGTKKTLKLSKMYLLYRGFRMGLATSVYTDGDAIPYTIDPQGPNGAISLSTYQLAYIYDTRNLSMSVGMEKPSFDSYSGVYRGKDYPEFDNQDIYGNASQSCPDFTGYLQYQTTNKAFRVRASGIIRNFRYIDKINDSVEGTLGWGAMLSGNIKPARWLTLYYEASYGKGTAAYYQDLNGLPLSYIPTENPYKMTASPMMGWLGGFSIKGNKKVSISAVFSQNRVWNAETYYPGYRYGLYGECNMTYRITPFLQWGIEYIYGQLATYTGKASDNRLQTAVRFSL